MEIEMNVSLPIFEGPLDLLLHLLEKNEVDIYDIPIHLITTQFMSYLNALETHQLDVTSEFIVMASHLLEIKSKMLLPIHDFDEDELSLISEDDPRFNLVQRLVEYKQYKEAAHDLQERQNQYDGSYYRTAHDLGQYTRSIDLEDERISLDIEALRKALQQVIDRIPEVDYNRKAYFERLKRDVYTVEEKIDFLKQHFKQVRSCSFEDLIHDIHVKQELVVMFLALLELLKAGDIRVLQEETFETIRIEVCEGNR